MRLIAACTLGALLLVAPVCAVPGPYLLEELPDRFFYGTPGATLVVANDTLYAFGGHGHSTPGTQISRIDPVTGIGTLLPAALPYQLQHAAGAWDGRYIYLFGGILTGTWTDSDRIIRFDPADGTMTELAGRLPRPRHAAGAGFDGRHIYVFGGVDLGKQPQAFEFEILRFDPQGGVVQSAALLPSRYADPGQGVVFDGAHFYLFGALRTELRPMRFNPASGTTDYLAPVDANTPGMTALWDGQHVYLVGSELRYGPKPDGIVRYNPSTGQVDEMPDTVPYQPGEIKGAWLCGAGLVFREVRPFSRWTGRMINQDHVFRFGPSTPSCNTFAAQFDHQPGTSCQTAASSFQDTSKHGVEPIVSYLWDFGDGRNSTLRNPSHYYLVDGPRSVTLTVTDVWGLQSKATVEVPVFNAVACCPALNVLPDYATREGQELRFMVSATDPLGQATTLRLEPLPEGATFDAATGWMQWAPERGQYGDYFLKAYASSSHCENDANVRIHVAVDLGNQPDADVDGIADAADNCPTTSNRDQRDTDDDGTGDACDPTPCAGPCSGAAESPTAGSAPSKDHDGDGVEALDNCPHHSNPGQADVDNDGVGDACDTDLDGDGMPNHVPGDFQAILDNCPDVSNPDQRDTDADGTGDACESGGRGASEAVPLAQGSNGPPNDDRSAGTPALMAVLVGVVAVALACRRSAR